MERRHGAGREVAYGRQGDGLVARGAGVYGAVMTTFAEQLRLDPAFRAFVDAQIGHAGVELAALRVEHERDQRLLRAQAEQIKRLEAQLRKRGQ